MGIDIKKIQKTKPISELLEFSIINLDKPTGPTSFSVSHYVKKALNLRKTSHLGTLDPIVTGVLPVALNRACRLNDYLMHRDKTYVGIMRLHKEVSDEVLKKEIKSFIGTIKQLPPLRSRVKRAVREREIKRFEILERDGKDVLFLSEVQAGTYIRKLCDDLGKKIGGAHMLELRRTKAGIFDEKDIVNLYDFEKAVEEYANGNEKPLRNILIPGEIVSQVLPVVQIRKDVIKKVYTGSPVFSSFVENPEIKENLAENDKIAVFSEDKFIGCYKFIGKGDLFARPEFVLN
ncbi:MAG: RNA-guided pseudouridylation complex pseudouridine synthase subunit Cbf5 [archaeon]|jgi:H/ACA ribonucleoprotein complex subunit 4|nr:RNA-guided pseudouridylation complex pseudouridine synthase subunit Cbf5 [archaeon]